MEASVDQVSKPVSFQPSLSVLSPQDAATISVKEDANNQVKFMWQAFEEGLTYRWKLFADANAEDLLLEKSTSETQIELAYIDVGTVYWRIEATVDEVLYKSPLRRLNVQKDDN